MRSLSGQDASAICACVVLCIAWAKIGGNRATAGFIFDHNEV